MKKSENMLVLGLGGVGRYLARRLSQDGHAVTVIDSNLEKVERARRELDARVVCADALDANFWRTPDARAMDFVIAVTDSDATNIMACMVAKQLDIRQKIARVRAIDVWSDHALIPAAELGIDLVIRPEEIAAEEICRFVTRRVGNAIVDVGYTPLQIISTHINPNSPLDGMALRDLAVRYTTVPMQIVGVVRDIKTILPGGDFQLAAGDHIYMLAHSDDVPALAQKVGVCKKAGRRVMILGGSDVGVRVAARLQDEFSVRLLERDERRAEELSQQLPRTECLHGDGSHRDTLMQAGLLAMDTMIVATEDNLTNIMTAVMAKHVVETRDDVATDPTTVTLVNHEDYLVLASRLGADLAVNKRILAANRVLRYVRRGHVLSLAHLHGADAEVIELLADPGSPITQKSVGELDLTGLDIRIGAVGRDRRWRLAIGSTQIRAGDRVICVCASEHLSVLQDLFLA